MKIRIDSDTAWAVLIVGLVLGGIVLAVFRG